MGEQEAESAIPMTAAGGVRDVAREAWEQTYIGRWYAPSDSLEVAALRDAFDAGWNTFAQALAADPGVRAAVEREALERAAQAIEAAPRPNVRVYGEHAEVWQHASNHAARMVRDLMPRKEPTDD